MRFPRTLFAQTVATIAAVSLAFLIFSLSVIAYFMLVPVGKSSADDLATLMVITSQTSTELPPSARSRLEKELADNYQIRFGDSGQALPLADRPPWVCTFSCSRRQRKRFRIWLQIWLQIASRQLR